MQQFFRNRLKAVGVLVLGVLAACQNTAPPTPPGVPGNLSAQATPVPSVNLTWNAVSDAAGYVLERKVGSDGTYTQIATPSNNSFSDTSGVAFSTTYQYRVKAIKGDLSSSFSNVASVTTPAAPTAPPAAPANLNLAAATGPAINLAWTASDTASSYVVERKETGGSYAAIGTPTSPSYSDTSISANKTYTYRVKAINSAGSSGYSNEPSLSTTLPAVPTSLIAGAASPTSVSLSWPASSGATSYTLERKAYTASGYSPVSPSINGTQALDVAESNMTYTYRIRANNLFGSSDWLESNRILTPGACNAAKTDCDSPAQKGYFGPVFQWPVIPTFTALMANGKVMAYYSDDPVGVTREDVSAPHVSTLATVWDPALPRDYAGTVSGSSLTTSNGFSSPQNNTNGTDLFCAGFTILTDGNYYAVGGNVGATYGSKNTNLYDPLTNTWTNGPTMWAGRWYPTATKLPNGDVLITGGTATPSLPDGSGGYSNIGPKGTWNATFRNKMMSGDPSNLNEGLNVGKNNLFEIYSPATGLIRDYGATASAASAADLASFEHYYPWWYVAPNGLAFLAGGGKQKRFFNWQTTTFQGAGPGEWASPAYLSSFDDFHRVYGTSVMYEPGKILVTGGGYDAVQGGVWQQNNTNTAYTIQLQDNPNSTPTFTQLPGMHYRRTHSMGTILADGKVLITGGQQDFGESGTPPASDPTDGSQNPWRVTPLTVWNTNMAVRPTEIWDPNSPNQWKLTAKTQEERIYHHISLLLPDATVLVAGGGGCGTCEDTTSYPISMLGSTPAQRAAKINKTNGEIFYPPYLFKANNSFAPRPIITGLSGTGTPDKIGNPSIGYAQNFTVNWTHAESGHSISKVTFVALSAPTHAFNENQRILSLSYSSSGNTLTVTSPANANLAPPGHYMLFVIDDQGVPSVAKIVQIKLPGM